jgi:hypothetical protein
MRRELISNALNERFRELCDRRIPYLQTAACGPANFFLQVREQFSGISPADARKLIFYPRAPDFWKTSQSCRHSLIALSLGTPLDLHRGERPPVEPFIELLNESSADPARRVELLNERYASPLNFTLPEEAQARELVLMRLMAHDRARIEKDSVRAVNHEDLLLKLNLVAVYAVHQLDLRFLDALNYYYELLPLVWPPTGSHDALLASYHALYAQALAAWM